MISFRNVTVTVILFGVAGCAGVKPRESFPQVQQLVTERLDKRIEWHIAEPGAMRFFRDATYADRPPIVVQQTPAR